MLTSLRRVARRRGVTSSATDGCLQMLLGAPERPWPSVPDLPYVQLQTDTLFGLMRLGGKAFDYTSGPQVFALPPSTMRPRRRPDH